MHIVPVHRGDEIQSESKDSEYDTTPGDEGSSGSMLSMIGPVTRSQIHADQLNQSIQAAWTLKMSNTTNASKIITFPCSQQIAGCPCHHSECWLNIFNFNHGAWNKCLHMVYCN